MARSTDDRLLVLEFPGNPAGVNSTWHRLILASLPAFWACGSDPAPGPLGYQGPTEITLPDGKQILDPPPPANGQQLTSERFTLAAGEEKYFCYTFRSPADGVRAITEITPIATGVVHHEVIFQTLVDEPEGFFECPILQKASWQPIWAGGAGARGLKLPTGVAFKLPANTQYMVQYHLLNTGASEVTSRAAFNLTYAEDPSTQDPAGLFALGSFNFEIPANNNKYELSVKCNSPKEMKVFAAFPHLHQFGTRVTFEMGASEAGATKAYEIAPWRFGDQPMDPVDFTVHPGDFMRATCEWNNDTPRPITYGESSNDEMCFMILFYHPFDNLDGCLD